ncbi:MAG: SDR family oxidoreductase [Hyphomicrobiales bacterium]|nr:MAG: SDR family oxidoreductase [Hyphomicrobiales bacterium]
MTKDAGSGARYRSVFRPGLFAGQVIVVTGGGSGIGRCAAHELASLGAKVALVGRKAEKIAAVAREIAEDVGAGLTSEHVCDIRVEEQVAATVADILKAHGRIDGLVNNAGGQFAAPLVSITQKGWETVVRTNLTGGFLMARECYTQWMQGRGGSIVNVVADMWLGMPSMGHSGAARAGMVNFTETAANEWSVSNVRVNAVAPGWIASSGMDQYPPEMGERIRNMKNMAPLGRMGSESEVSSAIVFLLSEGAQYISGTTLRVDGAVPNTKVSRPLPPNPHPLPRYDGFHRAKLPKVLGEE